MRATAVALLFAIPSLLQASQVDAARGVLERTVGSDAAARFEFREIPSESGKDVFEVEARGGKATVSGSTGVAIARGAYEYIRDVCHRQVSWERPVVQLPTKLPDQAKRRVVCPNQYRHYFNVCTFGYSTVWWDWKRWRQEIDWMALHGINMPLAMEGQEAIWQRVFKEFGMTRADLDAYFTGPAFLPWHRMGNLNAHAGPLPQSWIDSHAALQKQILQGERELGMTPVTPGFSGFVPPAFQKRHPEVKVTASSGWAGFDPTFFISPSEPMFRQIGKRFIEEYVKEYGTDHLYLADTFNEMPPQFKPETKLKDLAASGKAVYDAITAGDPQGIWVMQGWLFYNERSYWGTEEVKALLDPVPDDRMILLDLSTENIEIWRTQEAFRKKKWIECTLHNFGQTTALHGNLKLFSTRPIEALKDPNHGGMAGMGITMEGIEQNPVVYELATDTMWRTEPVDLPKWIDNYVMARYGSEPKAIREAWQTMLTTVYAGGGLPQSDMYMRRPGVAGGGEPGPDLDAAQKLLKLLVDGGKRLKNDPEYQRDLVDVGKRYVEEIAAALLYEAMTAQSDGDLVKYDIACQRYLQLLGQLDLFLGTRPEYRLGNWINSAKRWTASPEETKLLEQNARMQVTVWGGPVLYDYAWKEWSGLTRTFYAERWRRFFATLRAVPKGKAMDLAAWDKDIAAWELSWTAQTNFEPMAKVEDPYEMAKGFLKAYGNLKAVNIDRGIAVGKPVTSSGGTEGSSSPSYITDGYASGRYWAASPSPQWVQIDLQKPTEIGSIQVFPYFDGERYYRYTISVSSDGKDWKQVVDMSQNTTPASSRGVVHDVGRTTARYIRVNMISNSANIGLHLYEVRVFAPK